MQIKCATEGYSGNEKEFELVKIEKTKAICSQCEEATETKAHSGVPMAIISCEGACLRGEISRRVANNLCFKELPQETFRVCLGGAFTKDTNQRKLVRNSQRVIILEGCAISCASRMIKGILPKIEIETIFVNSHYKLNNSQFALNDMSEEEIRLLTEITTTKILEVISQDIKADDKENNDKCYC